MVICSKRVCTALFIKYKFVHNPKYFALIIDPCHSGWCNPFGLNAIIIIANAVVVADTISCYFFRYIFHMRYIFYVFVYQIGYLLLSLLENSLVYKITIASCYYLWIFLFFFVLVNECNFGTILIRNYFQHILYKIVFNISNRHNRPVRILIVWIQQFDAVLR